MEYLSKDYIVYLNQLTLEVNGGLFIPPHNFLHGEQLDYITDIVREEMFGEPLYPTITDKAAVYMFSIISNHIFADGNKRTGLAAAIVFLRKNGLRLAETLEDKSGKAYPEGKHKGLERFTLDVASGDYTLDECRVWFELNTQKVAQAFTPPKNPE